MTISTYATSKNVFCLALIFGVSALGALGCKARKAPSDGGLLALGSGSVKECQVTVDDEKTRRQNEAEVEHIRRKILVSEFMLRNSVTELKGPAGLVDAAIETGKPVLAIAQEAGVASGEQVNFDALDQKYPEFKAKFLSVDRRAARLTGLIDSLYKVGPEGRAVAIELAENLGEKIRESRSSERAGTSPEMFEQTLAIYKTLVEVHDGVTRRYADPDAKFAMSSAKLEVGLMEYSKNPSNGAALVESASALILASNDPELKAIESREAAVQTLVETAAILEAKGQRGPASAINEQMKSTYFQGDSSALAAVKIEALQNLIDRSSQSSLTEMAKISTFATAMAVETEKVGFTAEEKANFSKLNTELERMGRESTTEVKVGENMAKFSEVIDKSREIIKNTKAMEKVRAERAARARERSGERK